MDVPFTSPSHGDLLQLVVQLALLLGLARLLGELSRRVGQPAVVGEILAGVILGPSVLGALAPGVAEVWLPASTDQAKLLETMALLGAVLLLVITGFQTDLELIRRRAGAAVGVAVGGLVLPFAAGMALGWWFPDDLVGESGGRVVFALFLATAMAVSAIPVLASILLELGLMRRDIGQTMLAAGMVDDLVGWVVLGIAAALAGGGEGLGTVGGTFLAVVLFVAVTVGVGPFLVTRTVRFVHGFSGTPHRFLTAVLALVFAWAAFSQALHLEPVIGAFAMGILLGRVRRLPASVAETLEGMALGVFAPVFFGVVGLKVDIATLGDPRLAGLTAGVIAAAVIGKVAGAYAGGRWLAGADHWAGLSYGVGLAARGAIGVVVATVGRSLGVFTEEVFSMIVVMAVVTSLLTPAALKMTMRRVVLGDEERSRLRREDAGLDAVGGRLRRVLVTIRPAPEAGDTLDMKAALVRRLASTAGLAVTVMSASAGTERPLAEQAVRRVARVIAPRADVTSRVVLGDPVGAILEEAAKGYDLVVLGATDLGGDPGALFGGLVDEIVRMAPVPTLVVRGAPVSEGWSPVQILIPTDGSPAGERAADLAFAIAGSATTVTALHVLSSRLSPVISVSDTGPMRQFDRAHEVVSRVRDRGQALGVATASMVEMAPDLAPAIVAAARRVEADLVLLGTSTRAGTHRLYLGPSVEHVFAACPSAVAVLNT